MKIEGVLTQVLIWRLRHVSNRNFILILGSLIGVLAGVVAVTLKAAVHFVQEALELRFGFAHSFNFLFPFVGLLITYLLSTYILHDRPGHGITDILFSIAQRSSIIARTRMYSHMIMSVFTVGFGGSAGLEAPSVLTGSALGSNIGRLMHINSKKRTLLIGCGAAGAISGIFNAPVAGVIFSIEVILAEVSLGAFIPLLLASVFASLVNHTLADPSIQFYFQINEGFVVEHFPFYSFMGIACGFVAVMFRQIVTRSETLITRFTHPFVRLLVGALGLSVVVLAFPAVYGEGYDMISSLLTGDISVLHFDTSLFGRWGDAYPWLLVLFMLLLIIMKTVATGLTLGAGGSGGTFGPSLVIGGLTGFFFSRLLNYVWGEAPVPEANLIMTGMCAMMSGVQYAPLTAIFMIAEVTGGYALFVPLMIVSALAYTTASLFEPYSIYTKRLIERGQLLRHDKDKQVLSVMKIRKLIEKDLLPVNRDSSLGDILKLVTLSKRNIFPVLDAERRLVGIITLDDFRKIMFDEEAQRTVFARDLMHSPPAEVGSDENMATVMEKFERTGAWNLPVIDDGKYVGFLSKSRIFNAYRGQLIRQNRE
ncbi:chloride channel protein, CIC family [Catalinimonas alkaloidigena]|uniref:Chloride channel protein, CIC family n=1 Tax=Catalinimonas alkaloidigena TaxID=1075417 RepID=A0A1G9M520_9BACT|nr:chloride channel protein [Catalinimonas alkaloidigena]SDL69359.1 chloride channel protein, CIC family [Catalinimonas alkaloidigena]